VANTGNGFGLLSFGWPAGGSPMAQQQPYTIRSSNATAVYTGDLVMRSSTDPSCVTLKTSVIEKVVGVFVGCTYYSPTVGRVVWNNYFPGSVATSCGTADVTAYVIDDPNASFLSRGSTVAVMSSSYVGYNVEWDNTQGGTAATGRSLGRIDSSTITANASCPLRIVGLYSDFAPPGAEGTDDTTLGTGNIAVVVLNNAERKSLTAYAT
jgi:hypothetical protein